MKTKGYLFLLFIVLSSFRSISDKSGEDHNNQLVILKKVLQDKDFQLYFKSKNLKLYPVIIKYADKNYLLPDSQSAFEEVILNPGEENLPFRVADLYFKDSRKAKIKINYLDIHFQLTVVKINPCLWKVCSILARNSSDIKPDFYVLK